MLYSSVEERNEEEDCFGGGGVLAKVTGPKYVSSSIPSQYVLFRSMFFG